jgi:hypothetical protein
MIEINQNEIFYCTGSEAEGKAIYTSEGLVVLKGSSGRANHVKSFPDYARRTREELVENGTAVIIRDRFVLKEDYLANSPSAGGAILTGRRTDGWLEWKDRDNRTLRDVLG